MDDDYVPQPKRIAPIVEPRVMRLEELHDKDRIAVERAIRRIRPDLDQSIVEAEVVDAEAYCGESAALKDFRNMQQRNADVTGRVTYLHRHKMYDDCEGRSHEQFMPDPKRAAAVGGANR